MPVGLWTQSAIQKFFLAEGKFSRGNGYVESQRKVLNRMSNLEKEFRELAQVIPIRRSIKHLSTETHFADNRALL
jgi:hypothetical protein